MTDKAAVELPSPYPGRISNHCYEVGQIAIKDRSLYEVETDVEIKNKHDVLNDVVDVPKSNSPKNHFGR